jgi:hypothetical protein
MPYTPQTSNRVGGIFVSANGKSIVIPNRFLAYAKLVETTMLRLHYSFGTVEISGERLGNIFHDVSIGKLGTVTVDAPDSEPESTTAPAITNIVLIPESSYAASERERSNA